MASDEKRWHLYCVETQQKLSGLTEPEALAHVKTLTADAWPHWFAWTKGLQDWVPIEQCTEFTASRERRQYPRVQIRVIITIFVGFQRFQTFTRDISTNGVHLDREMPFSPPHEKCRVILRYADIMAEELHFNARFIMDRKHPIRLEFLSAEEKFKKKLAVWVDRALQVEKDKKKAA